MKLSDTEFFKEFTAIVAGCVLVVATVAFVSVPASLAHVPGDPAVAMDMTRVPHLT